MKVFSDLGKLVTGRRRPVALLVDDGRVWCPARGDIGVEECVGCPRMLAFDGHELTCRDDRAWWFVRSP